MMNWLRVHTKQIMVVVVLMAMLAFIGGDALTTLFAAGNTNEDYGRVFGKKIKTNDLIPSQNETEILRNLGFQFQFAQDGTLAPQHFHMLVAEASAAGLDASQAEIDQELKNAQVTPVVLQSRHLGPANVYEAVGHYIQIRKNAERVLSASIPSEAETRHYAVDTEERATVKMVVFDAAKFVDPAEVIPEAEIQAQFDKYKDVLKKENEYGYKHPPRVKLQVIVADFAKIAEKTTILLEEASAHWRKNKAAYTITDKIPITRPATSDPAESRPTTMPEPEPSTTEVTREMTFSEARSRVEGEIRKKRGAQLAEQAMRKASVDLLKPWYEVPTDKTTGYKSVAAAAKEPDYMEAVRAKAASEAGIALDFIEIGPISKEELAKHPIVGKARVGGSDMQRLTLVEYAFRVPPLYKVAGEYDSTLRLQQFQTPDAPLVLEKPGSYTVQQDASGQYRAVPIPGEKTGLVLFRVVEALEAAAPATLDEVREQVVKDLREERAYARMESAARQLLAAARKVGLTDALSLDESLKTKLGISAVATPNPFARKMGGELAPATVDGVGASEEFLTSVFSMSAPDWTPAEPEAAAPESPELTTRPAVAPAPKVALVNLPKAKKRVVVEFLELAPLTEDRFTSQVRNSAYTQLFQRRLQSTGNDWFKPANIEKRCRFEPLAAAGSRIPAEGVQADPEGEPPI